MPMLQLKKKYNSGYTYEIEIPDSSVTFQGFLEKVDEFPCLIKSMLNDTTRITEHFVFNKINVGIPVNTPMLNNNAALGEKLGYAYFASEDGSVDITLNMDDVMPLDKLKAISPALSKELYGAEIIKSEIRKINGINVYVLDMVGYWNGHGNKIGIFRYYLNSNKNSFNLLMKYPAKDVNRCIDLKDKMLNSITLVKNTNTNN